MTPTPEERAEQIWAATAQMGYEGTLAYIAAAIREAVAAERGRCIRLVRAASPWIDPEWVKALVDEIGNGGDAAS